MSRKSFQGRDPLTLHGGGGLLFIGVDSVKDGDLRLGGFYSYNNKKLADKDAVNEENELVNFTAVGGGGRSLPNPDFITWEDDCGRVAIGVASKIFLYKLENASIKLMTSFPMSFDGGNMIDYER